VLYVQCIVSDIFFIYISMTTRGGRDRMVVGFTITYYMQSEPITNEVVSSNPAQGRCTRYNIM